MGVNLRDLLIRRPITLEQLSGKTLVVDGNNMMYQFLSTIRGRDGNLLTNHNGQVSSHLIGLFSRVANLLQKNIKLVFVFDGKVPQLKHKELARRAEVKKEAEKLYAVALAEGDAQGMQKYGGRTSRLTKEMIAQARELLGALGIPSLEAPSEGEAQASAMVKNGDGWAVVSQDYDSLVFGAPRIIQNLSIEGRRKVAGTLGYKTVEPLLIDRAENMEKLGLSDDQLLWLAMLVGTDYAQGGVHGIGPKKGLALVKKASSASVLFGQYPLEDGAWQDVVDVFKKMPVTTDYELKWSAIDRGKVQKLLVEDFDFGAERVEKVLDQLAPLKQQKSLGEF